MTSDENYTVFRECLSSAIVARSEDRPKTVKRRQKLKRNGRKEATTSSEIATIYTRADPEELAEFIDVLLTPRRYLFLRSQYTDSS
jgi:hypothetical protein